MQKATLYEEPLDSPRRRPGVTLAITAAVNWSYVATSANGPAVVGDDLECPIAG